MVPISSRLWSNRLHYIACLCLSLCLLAGGIPLSYASSPAEGTTIELTTSITDPVEVLFQIGLGELGRGNYASAIKIFRSLAETTTSPRVQLELARALFLDHRYRESAEVFNEVLHQPNLPWTVQENIRSYLDAIDAALGYLKFGFSLVSDSNPRNFTDSRQVRIAGQLLTIIPPSDNRDITGVRYSVNAARAFTDTAWLSGYLNASFVDYENSQFDRFNGDVGLFFTSRTFPKLKLRVGLEESYLGGHHYYEFPYAGLIYTPSPVYQFRTSSELKVGELEVPNAAYLDATNLSLTTKVVRPITEKVQSSWELYLEQSIASTKTYSYYGAFLGTGLSFPVLQSWQLRPYLNVGQRNYESADPFFGKTRRDSRQTFGIEIYNEEINLFGMIPGIELRYDENNSNIAFYSYDKFVVQLNVKQW